MPVSLFQMLFALVNPMQAALKFQKLARLDPDGPAARLFVALEDWLADGVPMPAGAAKDLLVGWQIRNPTARRPLALPRRRRSTRGGSPRRRSSSAARRDTIAPPPLAAPLGRPLPGAAHASSRAPAMSAWWSAAPPAARSGGRWRSSSPPMSVEPALPLCDDGTSLHAPGGDSSDPARDLRRIAPPRRG